MHLLGVAHQSRIPRSLVYAGVIIVEAYAVPSARFRCAAVPRRSKYLLNFIRCLQAIAMLDMPKSSRTSVPSLIWQRLLPTSLRCLMKLSRVAVPRTNCSTVYAYRQMCGCASFWHSLCFSLAPYHFYWPFSYWHLSTSSLSCNIKALLVTPVLAFTISLLFYAHISAFLWRLVPFLCQGVLHVYRWQWSRRKGN